MPNTSLANTPGLRWMRLALLGLVVLGGVFLHGPRAEALPLIAPSVTPGSLLFSANTTYAVSLTTALETAPLSEGSFYLVTFPAGFNAGGAMLDSESFTPALAGAFTIVGTSATSVTLLKATLVPVPAGTVVAFTLSNIVNPMTTNPGDYMLRTTNNSSIIDTATVPGDTFVAPTPTGTIDVVKDLNPSGDVGRFDLQIDGVDQAMNAGDTDSTGAVSVSVATHMVGEIGGDTPATNLADYTSSISCDETGGENVTQDPLVGTVDVPVTDGDVWVCTITNTRNGAITIVKDTVPDDAQDFAFDDDITGDGGTGGGERLHPGRRRGRHPREHRELHERDAGAVHSAGDGGRGLDAERHRLRGEPERGGGGSSYLFQPSNMASFQAGDISVDITLAAGDAVTCTFTNTEDGAITIVKDTVPDDAQDFVFDDDITGDGGMGGNDFTLDDDADGTLSNTESFANVTPGVYTVRETVVAGWVLSDIDCGANPSAGGSSYLFQPSGMVTFQVGDISVDITLAAGDAVTCTFTNTETATVTVTKVINDEFDDRLTDEFTVTINGGNDLVVTNTGADPDMGTSATVMVDGGSPVTIVESITAGPGALGDYTRTLSCRQQHRHGRGVRHPGHLQRLHRPGRRGRGVYLDQHLRPANDHHRDEGHRRPGQRWPDRRVHGHDQWRRRPRRDQHRCGPGHGHLGDGHGRRRLRGHDRGVDHRGTRHAGRLRADAELRQQHRHGGGIGHSGHVQRVHRPGGRGRDLHLDQHLRATDDDHQLHVTKDIVDPGDGGLTDEFTVTINGGDDLVVTNTGADPDTGTSAMVTVGGGSAVTIAESITAGPGTLGDYARTLSCDNSIGMVAESGTPGTFNAFTAPAGADVTCTLTTPSCHRRPRGGDEGHRRPDRWRPERRVHGHDQWRRRPRRDQHRWGPGHGHLGDGHARRTAPRSRSRSRSPRDPARWATTRGR